MRIVIVTAAVDGLGIGLGLHLSLATGLLVFAAVASHDVADGLNTVSFILRQGGGRRRALRWLAVDATAPIAGAAVGASLSISAHALGALLSLYVGFFLFLGASDLLPEAHEHPLAVTGGPDRDRLWPHRPGGLAGRAGRSVADVRAT
jgi:ZIP family zinc transporter